MRVQIHPNPALYLSPEMVNELALGMDPPDQIAATYGLSEAEFAALSAQDWFGELILKKRLELQDKGIVFTAKAGMMAEELWQRLYQKAITGDMSSALVMDMAKQLTDIGQLRPKPSREGAEDGAKFQININVGDVAPTIRTIEAKAEAIPTLSIPLDSLPPKPEGFRVPDFRLTPDLVGNSQAVTAALTATPA